MLSSPLRGITRLRCRPSIPGEIKEENNRSINSQFHILQEYNLPPGRLLSEAHGRWAGVKGGLASPPPDCPTPSLAITREVDKGSDTDDGSLADVLGVWAARCCWKRRVAWPPTTRPLTVSCMRVLSAVFSPVY